MDSDFEYFTKRAADERRAGLTATSDEVRRRHFELAAAYEDKIKDLSPSRRPTLRINAV
jgi:hypothetical protein